MARNGTMMDWINHGLHTGETIEQVEFMRVPENSGIPVEQKMRLPVAKKYLELGDATKCHIRINTKNSKDGDRVWYIQNTGCVYCSVRKWLGFVDLADHFRNCPGAEPHLHNDENEKEHAHAKDS